jgi:PilZ domain-containing protein
MDRREHHRAQLRLPVRLRWSTPFGQKTEVCKTLDISRGGLLVPCNEGHALGVPLWVTFPYDPSLRDGQPEMLAKVVRVTPGSNGSAASAAFVSANKLTKTTEAPAVALHFQPAFHPESNGNGQVKERERRGSARRLLAVPLRVRLEHVPWFEEAMTIDVSAQGLRFLSSREYSPGANLFVSFDPSASVPWPTGTEVPSRVVRIEPVPQSSALAITITKQS